MIERNRPKQEWPTLYRRDANDTTRVWAVRVDGNTIHSKAGVLGGKMTPSIQSCIGKGGRTDDEQALLEAEAMYKLKLRTKYCISLEETTKFRLRPMLAKPLDKNWNKVAFPCYVDPKLDGVRCMAYMVDDCVRLMSRSGLDIRGLNHVESPLATAMRGGFEDVVVDGELWVPGSSFQEVQSLVANEAHLFRSQLQYHVFDVAHPDKVEHFSDRLIIAGRLRNKAFLSSWQGLTTLGDSTSIKFVETHPVTNVDELYSLEDQFVAAGYEGLMYRNPVGVYEWGKRSSMLMKLKRFHDAEYEIVDVLPGVGNFHDQGTFVCKVDRNFGKTFNCTPAVDEATKREYLANKQKYIGRMLTVKMVGLTDDGMPKHAVGKAIREKGL